jgi:hypothetical protein
VILTNCPEVVRFAGYCPEVVRFSLALVIYLVAVTAALYRCHWPDAARSLAPLRVALPELPPPPVRAIHLSALSHLSPEASRV